MHLSLVATRESCSVCSQGNTTGVKVFHPHLTQAGLGPVETAKAARVSQLGPRVEFSLLFPLLCQNRAHPTRGCSVRMPTSCPTLWSIRTLTLGDSWSRNLCEWFPSLKCPEHPPHQGHTEDCGNTVCTVVQNTSLGIRQT